MAPHDATGKTPIVRAGPLKTRPDCVGIILAGGLSRRMGGADKGPLPLAGRPMLAHIIERLENQAQPIALNANGDVTRFARFGLPIVKDSLPGFAGPLAGVLAGMRWAKANSGARWIVTVPGDTPFLPRNLVECLFAAHTPAHEIVIAKSRGEPHPVIGIWRVALADQLTEWLQDGGNRKTMDWVETRSFFALEFADQAGCDPFFNVNTQQDLDTASAWAEAEIRQR